MTGSVAKTAKPIEKAISTPIAFTAFVDFLLVSSASREWKIFSRNVITSDRPCFGHLALVDWLMPFGLLPFLPLTKPSHP